MRSQSVANAVKDSLPLLQHQIGSSLCATPASLCWCALRDAATDRQSPQPLTQVFVCDAENWLQDGNAHQRRRERDTLKRNRSPVFLAQWHNLTANRRHHVARLVWSS